MEAKMTEKQKCNHEYKCVRALHSTDSIHELIPKIRYFRVYKCLKCENVVKERWEEEYHI